MGVSDMAASADVTAVDRRSPRAVAQVATRTMTMSSPRKARKPPWNPRPKNTIPRRIVHWITQMKTSGMNLDRT